MWYCIPPVLFSPVFLYFLNFFYEILSVLEFIHFYTKLPVLLHFFSFSSQAACLHYISWHAPLGLLETGILSFKERATLSVGYGLVWYNWGMVWYGRTRELYGVVEVGKRHFVCCRLSAKYLIATLTTVSTSSPQCIMHDTAGGLQMQKQPSSK